MNHCSRHDIHDAAGDPPQQPAGARSHLGYADRTAPTMQMSTLASGAKLPRQLIAVPRANARPSGRRRSPMPATSAWLSRVDFVGRRRSSPFTGRGACDAPFCCAAGKSQHGSQCRNLFRGGVALGDLDHGRSHRGMLPCLRCGADARFDRSMSRERMRIVRVSPGSMTSSTIPRSAAM